MPKLVLSILLLFVTMVANGQKTVAEEVVKIDASSATVHTWFDRIERQTKIILAYNPSQINLQQVIKLPASGKMTVAQLLDILLHEYNFKLIPLSNRKIVIQVKGYKVSPKPEIKESITDYILNISNQPATIEQWFHLIERQTKVLFIYPAEDINLKKTVKFERYGKITVKNLIAILLKDYEYKLTEPDDKHLKIEIKKTLTFYLTGIVHEQETGEKLLGATICVTNKNGKTDRIATDANGIFKLPVMFGTNKVTVSHMGYLPYEDTLNVQKDSLLSINLQPTPYQIKTIQIQRRRSKEEMNEVAPSNMISFSNSDIFSQIRVFPGVSLSVANTGLNVAGGAPDENLTLLEGFPLQNPNHLNTLLPIFNGDAVKSVSFYNGFIPTQYEGRLSSVMDVKLRDGNKSKYEHTASIDIPSISLVSEGPIVKNKLSYLAGGRCSWLDIFDHWVDKDNRTVHSFYDFNAKLAWDINSGSTLKLSIFDTKDNYNMYGRDKNASQLKWNSQLYTLHYNTIINAKMTNSTSLAYISTHSHVEDASSLFAKLKEIHRGTKGLYANTEFTYIPNRYFNMRWGAKTNYEIYDLAAFGTELSNRNEKVKQFSFFYDNRIFLTNWLYAQLGLHYVLYKPIHYKHHSSLQPRMSLKAAIGNSDLLSLTFLSMEQFHHHVIIADISAPFDFIMPSIEGFAPSKATHYEIGWKHYLKQGIIEFSAYYKRRNHLLALRPAIYVENSSWDKYIMTGEGESYGASIYFYNHWQKFTFQMAYTLSKSREWFDDLKERGKMPSLYDLPHVFNAAVSYDISKRSQFTIGGNIHSGKIAYDSFYGNTNNTKETFRKDREPTRYRLDVSYSYRKEFKKSKIFVKMGIYNLLGNPSKQDLYYNFSYKLSHGIVPFAAITFKF